MKKALLLVSTLTKRRCAEELSAQSLRSVGDHDTTRFSSPADRPGSRDGVGDHDVARLTVVPGLVPANSLRRLTPARLSQCRQHSSTLSTSEVNPRSVSHRDPNPNYSQFVRKKLPNTTNVRSERSQNLIYLLFCDFSQTR